MDLSTSRDIVPCEELAGKYLRPDPPDCENRTPSSSKVQMSKPITINDLPAEMLMKVFSYLDTEDLLDSVRHVSPYWDSLVKCRSVWKTQIFTLSKCACGQHTSEAHSAAIRETVSTLEDYPYVKHIQATGLNSTELQLLIGALCDNTVELKKVTISHCSLENSSALSDLFKTFQHIHTFHICWSDAILENGLDALANCDNLKDLLLSGNCFESDYELDLTKIAIGCPKLEKLAIRLFEYDPDSLAFLLWKKCGQLKSLEFNADFLDDDTVLPFNLCTCLESINCNIHFSSLTRQLLESISCAPHLKSLSLFQFTDIPFSMINDFFKHCSVPYLESLILSVGIIPDPVSHVIWKSSLRNVEALPVSWRYIDTDWRTKKMFTTQNLFSLQLRDFEKFPNIWADELALCDNLERLHIRNCDELTNEILTKMLSCLNLKFLYVGNCHLLTDDVLEQIATNCECLEELVFDYCEFSGACVVHMLSRLRLKHIQIIGCSNVTKQDLCQMKKHVRTVHYMHCME